MTATIQGGEIGKVGFINCKHKVCIYQCAVQQEDVQLGSQRKEWL